MYERQKRRDRLKLAAIIIAGKILSAAFLTWCYYFYHEYKPLRNSINSDKEIIADADIKIKNNHTQQIFYSTLEEIFSLDQFKKGIDTQLVHEFLDSLNKEYQVKELYCEQIIDTYKTDIVLNNKLLEMAKLKLTYKTEQAKISYNFLEDFFEQFPGYIRVINFDIVNKKISGSTFFESNLILEWYSYK